MGAPISHRTENVNKLTPKETEVLKVRARYDSDTKVAEELGLSAYTVKHHLRHIYEKLYVNSITRAVVVALKEGIIKIEEI